MFWKVTTKFFDNGKVDVYMESIQTDKRPTNTSKEFAKYDLYEDFFDTKADAEKFVVEAQHC